MKVEEALEEIDQFTQAVLPFFPKLHLAVSRPLDSTILPEQLAEVAPPTKGVYIFFRRDGRDVLYVGISKDVPGRLYHHLGAGFSWARDGKPCSFPNMRLAAERPWLTEPTQQLLRRGEFQIQVVGVEPAECAALLEAFLVARCFVKEGRRPEINVEY
jgi:hypothetical protein